ncbi:hypothetical protein B296_00038056 [Ensete ventricosum]|uniref:HTH myb-type domain-containing protein n=1 Tax=Ensete ventricosum TaxID=4639 RepID=A0A426Z0M0_ENSVE|nr:hypothetical protein B296_00038056 [Ensete ventricosum]
MRFEELRNIWQHVIRRRKFERRCDNDPDGREDGQKSQVSKSEDGQGAADHSGKINKKRKDQSEVDEDDSEDNMQDNEDPSAQKKPRVVWTIELHRKFVGAVNQLGVDMAGHQASIAAAVGGRSPSYLHMTSFNGLRNYCAINGSKQLPILGSLQQNGLGRMNSPLLGMHALVPSQTVRLGGVHKNASNPCNDLGKIPGITLQGNHQVNLLQGVPMALELERFPQPKLMQEAKSHLPAGLSDSELTASPCSNSFPNVTNNSLLVQANKQHNQPGGLDNFSIVRMPSLSSELFEIDLQDVSQFSNISRCDSSWQGAVASTEYSANALPILAPYNHNDIPPGNVGRNISSLTSHPVTRTLDESPNIKAVAPLCNPTTSNGVNQVCLLSGSTVPTALDKDPKFSNFNMIGNSQQKWDYTFTPNAISSASSSSSLPNLRITDAAAQRQTSEIVFSNKKLDVDSIGQVNFGSPLITQNCMIDKPTSDSQLNFKGEYAMGSTSLQSGLNSAGCSLDDLVNAMIKPVCISSLYPLVNLSYYRFFIFMIMLV